MLENLKAVVLQIFQQALFHKSTVSELDNWLLSHKVNKPDLINQPNPYYEPRCLEAESGKRNDIVFITSRFRSGSTVLWNLFRNIDGCTSYYEPFNERRWFDVQRRGDFTDKTHLGVNDYWEEYNGLEFLGKYYDDSWTRENLLMSEKSLQPAMKSYIDGLIESSPSRPILQFNRIDFRLAWFKKQYPLSKIIHLFRHPRDQWCSFLVDKTLMNSENVENTYRDAFYLDAWCEDLSKHFPFLDKRHTPHPYERFYLLWKLSYINGLKYSDISIDYNSLECEIFNEVLKKLNINYQYSPIAFREIFKGSVANKWNEYADNDWFEEKEAKCEYLIDNFLIAER